MIEDFQVKGLEKMANSGIINKIYPMVDRIEIKNEDSSPDHLSIDIILNDSSITMWNMYDSEFDPHYLIDKYLKSYFPYFGIEDVSMDIIVWSPDYDIIFHA